MIVDTSAVVAILRDEDDSSVFTDAIADAATCRMSVANVLEAYMVVEGRGGPESRKDLEDFLQDYEIEIVPVDQEQLYAAITAWRRFGRGNHPAKLNYGDCFAYALAYTTGESLLFKGDDFSLTDIPPALQAGEVQDADGAI